MNTRLYIVSLYLLLVIFPFRFFLGEFQFTGLRLFAILLILGIVLQRKWQFWKDLVWLDYIVLAYVGWLSVSLYINAPRTFVQAAGSIGLETIAGYIVGRLTIRSIQDFRTYAKLLAGLMLTIFPFALYEFLTGRPVLLSAISALPGLHSAPEIEIAARLGFERVQASFSHPIHFGLFSLLSAITLFATASTTQSKYLWFAALAAATSIGFSLSSGPIMGAALCFAVALALRYSPKDTSARILIPLAVLFAAFLVSSISDRPIWKVGFDNLTFSPHNAYWRVLTLEWGLKSISENPFFGIGFNEWNRPSFMVSGSIDNFWLLLALRYGLVAPALLVIFLLIITAMLVFRSNQDTREHKPIWLISMVGFVFVISTVHLWTSIYSFFFFFLGSGIWLSRRSKTASIEDDFLESYVRPQVI